MARKHEHTYFSIGVVNQVVFTTVYSGLQRLAAFNGGFQNDKIHKVEKKFTTADWLVLPNSSLKITPCIVNSISFNQHYLKYRNNDPIISWWCLIIAQNVVNISCDEALMLSGKKPSSLPILTFFMKKLHFWNNCQTSHMSTCEQMHGNDLHVFCYCLRHTQYYI